VLLATYLADSLVIYTTDHRLLNSGKCMSFYLLNLTDFTQATLNDAMQYAQNAGFVVVAGSRR